MNLINIDRDSHSVLVYAMEDGSVNSLTVESAFADFVMRAWAKRDACGFTTAKTPRGESSTIYVVPTTDGISFFVEPKRHLKIVHSERDNSQEAIVQITLEDEE